MFEPGEVISYLEMCAEEGVSLQRGMNFHLRGSESVILMSTRAGAPYDDQVTSDGRVLVYEGHDIAQYRDSPDPKSVDQPLQTPNGTLTQNGLFFAAAERYKSGKLRPEIVKVYEKIRSGIWVYNGRFALVDAWMEDRSNRKVCKFRLEMIDAAAEFDQTDDGELEHSRFIPSSVKLEVWKRDNGRCRICGSADNLHFDHIIPYSKGGSSLTAENIQLLCARHNLEKRDKIE